MTDEQLRNLIDFVGSAAKALEDKINELDNKLNRILADLNDRLPKRIAVPALPQEMDKPSVPGQLAPFFFVDSGSILTGDRLDYKFPIRVGAGGEIESATLTDGQFLTVSSGGTCTECVIKGTARFSAQIGAKINNLDVRDGAFVLLHDGGYIEDTDICSSGTIAVADGGSAFLLRVHNKGCLKINNGAKVSNVIVYDGGMIELNHSAAQLENIEITSGASVRWESEECKAILITDGAVQMASEGVVESLMPTLEYKGPYKYDDVNITSGGSSND